MSTQTIAVALHDGFYGAGTGAGYSNRAFLHVLTDHLPPGARLVALPVRLIPSSSEYDPVWHQDTMRMLERIDAEVRPVDNGTHGQVRFGGLAAFRRLARDTADAVTRTARTGADPLAVVLFDVPFLGVPPLLPPELLAHVTAVPRSSAVQHDPTNRVRVRFERHGLLTLAHHRGRIGAISTHMRDHLHEDYDVPQAALVDLRDGLTPADRQLQPPDPAMLPAAARGAGFILALGRAEPYKGWDDLIDALALLTADTVLLPHTVLAAVHEQTAPSPYQRHLASRITDLGLDATLLTSFDPRVRDLLGHPALRAVVVPSRAEPFGRIPLEAYAAGATPVVTTTAGGLSEQVIDGLTGITARPSDPGSLATAIRRALTLPPAQRDQMRCAGRELLANQFDYTSAVQAFLALIAPWATTRTDTSTPTARSRWT